jgi:hypothetical protein
MKEILLRRDSFPEVFAQCEVNTDSSVLGCTLRNSLTEKAPETFAADFSGARGGEEMTKRGKVLRDPLAGPGLLIAEGRQFQFVADGVWKSDVPAKPGLVVDIDFDTQGKIVGIAVVPDCQPCKEQAIVTPGANKGQALTFPLARLAQSELAQSLAAAGLVLSWFFLTAVTVERPFSGNLEFTLWQLLHRFGSGAYRGFALLAVLGPFVQCLWKDRQAAIGDLLPLSFMAFTGVLLVHNINSLFANGAERLYQQLPKQARAELIGTISLGTGTYVSIVICVYFAILGLKHFRKSESSEKRVTGQLQKAAA